MEPTTWDNVGDHYTWDGTLIVPGLRVLDYNHKETTVTEPVRYGNPAEAQWFKTANGGMFDGPRLKAI